MASIKINVGYNILLSLSQILFPLIAFPYVSRALGPAGLGVVSFADSFTQYFILIAALGVPVYGVREVAKVRSDRIKLGKLFSELLVINIFTTITCLAVYLGLITFLSELRVNAPVFLVGCGILFFNTFLVEWFFLGLEDFRYVFRRVVLFRAVTLVLIFLVVRSPDDKVYYYMITMAFYLLSAWANMIYARKFISLSFQNLRLKRHIRPLLLIFSTTMVISMYVIFDNIILGFLTNETFVGYYAVSIRISKFSLAIVGALGLVLIPRLTAVFQERDTSQATILLNKSVDYVILFSVPISFGILIMAPELVMLFGGAAYLPAVDSLRIFSLIVIILGFAQIFSQQILMPLNKEAYIFRSVLVGVVVSLVLNFLLIPIYKHTGAALSNLIAELVVTMALFWFSRKFLRLNFPFRSLVYSVVSCSLFYPIKLLVDTTELTDLIRVILVAGLSSASYFVFQAIIFKNLLLTEFLSGLYKWFAVSSKEGIQ